MTPTEELHAAIARRQRSAQAIVDMKSRHPNELAELRTAVTESKATLLLQQRDEKMAMNSRHGTERAEMDAQHSQERADLRAQGARQKGALSARHQAERTNPGRVQS